MHELNQKPSIPTSQTLGKSHGSKMMLFIFGALTILIGVGAYVFGANKAQTPVANNVISQPSPTPIDETANWSTYEDDRYGYGIKYPSNWYLVPTAKEGYGAVATITNYDSQKSSEKIGFTDDMIKIQINLLSKPAEKPFKDWAAASIQETLHSSVNKDYGMTLDSQTSISVNGIEARQYSFSYNTPLSSSLYIHFPKNSTDVLTISVVPSDSKDIKIFDQILSTFKFLQTNIPFISSTHVKRLFDVNEAFYFDGRPYPDEIINVDENKLLGLRCTEYYSNPYGDQEEHPEFANFDTKLQREVRLTNPLMLDFVSKASELVPKKQIAGVRLCETEQNTMFLQYDEQLSGGGAGKVVRLALVGTESKLIPIGSTINEPFAYFGCYDGPLQFTNNNILYYGCGAGDGGASSSSIYKIDINNDQTTRIIMCESRTGSSIGARPTVNCD